MSGIVGSKPGRMLIVDTDVHHGFAKKSDLFPYLSRYDAVRFEDYGFGIQSGPAMNGGFRGRRIDVIDKDNPPPPDSYFMGVNAFDVDDTRKRLLDEVGVDIAVLTGGPGPKISAMVADFDYANALCRAFNDYSLDHWIARDERFRLLLHVNTQDPAAAAAEIDRVGSHPGVCGILVGCGAPRPFGHRFYHPIYEACARHGLAVGMHFGGEGLGLNPPPSPAGYPSYYIEYRQLRSSFYSVHIASFVFEGVFDKFPTLKLAIIEAGFAWVPAMMWKMDLDWKGLRRQTPWIKRLPSEYIKEHVRFATQPMEEPEPPEALKHIIDWMDGSRTLMFSTDYPHWDFDNPAMILGGYPEDLRRRIFSANAIETFGLTLPSASKAA